MAKKKRAAEAKVDKSIGFEEALERLQQLVARLEDGNISLTEAMDAYEQGVKYLKHGYQLLEQAERKIELLTGIDSQGNPVTEPFEHQATASRSATKPSSKRPRASKTQDESTVPADGEDADIDLPGRLF